MAPDSRNVPGAWILFTERLQVATPKVRTAGLHCIWPSPSFRRSLPGRTRRPQKAEKNLKGQRLVLRLDPIRRANLKRNTSATVCCLASHIRPIGPHILAAEGRG